MQEMPKVRHASLQIWASLGMPPAAKERNSAIHLQPQFSSRAKSQEQKQKHMILAVTITSTCLKQNSIP